MKTSACLLAALIFLPYAGGNALSFNLEEAKNHPVTKVINLLKDMMKTLEKEQEEDEEIYDKMACWCDTNRKEKTKSIADAKERITALETEIEELTAKSAKLAAEIKELEKEVAANQEALEKATAIREKQLAEFNEEEKDLLESISALKAAVTVLSKHNPQPGGSAFLQVPRTHMLAVAATLQHELQKHDALLKGVLTRSERRAASAFIQSPQDYFDAEPTFKQSYAPQSGEIFGILSSMKDTFEENLSAAQKEELANQKAYEELKAAKEEEINAGQASIDKKTDEIAETDEKCAQAKEDLEDTKEALAADEKYLLMLEEKCKMTDEEWEERQRTRTMEIEACSKALAVLSGDDAHDLFSRTFNPSLMQTERALHSARRNQASKVLSDVAKKFNNPRLAALSYQVKLDAFTKVKKAIDDMVAQLLKEKEDEIKHKDFCIEELNTNQLQTEKKTREKEALLAKIEDLEMIIKDLTEQIATLKQEIEDLKVAMKRASETREIENKKFQEVVADQRETQKLLGAALKILEGFYKATPKPIMIQRQEPVGPPPPPGFEAYKKNEQSGGVMEMIEMIMADAKQVEEETVRDEEDAQKAYEDLIQESNQSIEAKLKSIADKEAEKAKMEEELVETKEARDAVQLELDELANYNQELHVSCDFTLKNFDLRQTARDEEIEALKQAKAILSGAKFEEFLQGR